MSAGNAIVALMYDFDKTLCTKDMQEYGFIPKIGMSAADFWKQSNQMAVREKMDPILAYMYQMIRKADSADQPIRRQDFVKTGRQVEFFPGLPEWFERIRCWGKEHHVRVEHYIISSGLKEIIEGSLRKGIFKEIYASEFHYNASGAADWPKLAVNYTAKTQFLFRINKGILDISRNNELNEYVPDHLRRVPFTNMIYIGDGLTDVPCMKLVKINKGKSIAVFQSGKKEAVLPLLRDGRVDYILKADYSQDSELETVIHEIIRKIAADDVLTRRHAKQMNQPR